MKLFPPCERCGEPHDPAIPHNAKSIPYQEYYLATFGRPPTWDDAMAHCSDEVKKKWREAMARVRENTDKLMRKTP